MLHKKVAWRRWCLRVFGELSKRPGLPLVVGPRGTAVFGVAPLEVPVDPFRLSELRAVLHGGGHG